MHYIISIFDIALVSVLFTSVVTDVFTNVVTDVLRIFFLLRFADDVGMASTESSSNAKCVPKVIMLGDKCISKNCKHKCIALGARSGNCIEGPACNCVFCGPKRSPPPLK